MRRPPIETLSYLGGKRLSKGSASVGMSAFQYPIFLLPISKRRSNILAAPILPRFASCSIANHVPAALPLRLI